MQVFNDRLCDRACNGALAVERHGHQERHLGLVMLRPIGSRHSSCWALAVGEATIVH